MKNILITGCDGFLATNFIKEFINNKTYKIVGVTDRKIKNKILKKIKVIKCDVRNKIKIKKIVKKFSIDTIFHLASLLSVNGENDPALTWDVNVNGLLNILEIAKEKNLKVFWPSSIAISSDIIYGKTKIAGELLCNYYRQKFNVDVRSLRLPGNISPDAIPLNGITGYATEMINSAIGGKNYVCYLNKNTKLPMIYVADTIKATLMLMNANKLKIKQIPYNLNSMNFSPKELENEIKKYFPNFNCSYISDERQKIANSYKKLKDSDFRQNFEWKSQFTLFSTVKDMINEFSK